MRKRISLLIIFIGLIISPKFLFAQESLNERVATLSNQIANQINDKETTKIAVVEFSDLRGNVTDFGRFLSEELITSFYQTNKFTVVERQMLNKIIREQKLTLKGVLDPSSAKQLGKILGVEAIVSGTITELSNSLRVNARIMNTKTGEIFGAASTQIYKNDSVIQLMDSGLSNSKQNNGQNPTTETKNNESDITQKAVSNQLLFKLKQVEIRSKTARINLTVTNKGEEREIRLFVEDHRGPCKLYDNQGTEYIASQGEFGSESDDYRVTKDLVSGVPVSIAFDFDNISETANKFTLLQIAFEDETNNRDGKVEFRDIPLDFGK